MVGIARQRLSQWADRAEVKLSDGSGSLEAPDQSVDRFVSNYVFDLLSPPLIVRVLEQAHRILAPDGLLCLVSLTYGRGRFAGAISKTWQRIHAFSPALVGGCRPLDLTAVLGPSWLVRYVAPVTNFGLTSQVLVASPSRSG
jgi:hypothetical protein